MKGKLAASRRGVSALLVLFSSGLFILGSPASAGAQKDPARPPQRAASRVPHRHTTEPRGAVPPLHQRCTRCHDADGTGQSSRDSLREIPDFHSHKWQASRSDAELLVSILEGKGKHMPSFRGKISDAEARDLIAAIRAFDSTPAVRPVADDPTDGFERRFRELQKELDELKRQFRELSNPPRKK
jgi:hypothetical protein